MRATRKLGEPPTSTMPAVNTPAKTETPPTRKTKAQQQSSSSKTAQSQQHVYSVGEKVLCLHQGSYYEAKLQSETVTETGERAFVVHYQGWNSRYDEQITISETPDRFRVFSAQAAAEAKKAQREAAGGGGKKPKSRSSGLDTSKLGGSTPSGTATSSRSSTPFESNKRRQARDSSLIDQPSGGKRSRQSGVGKSSTESSTPLSALVPPNQVGLLGQSVSSALAQAANVPVRKLPESFLENFPMSFCEILRSDHENIQKGRVPVMPARFTIEEIVGEYKESLGQSDNALMHVEYGPMDTLEQTTPAFLALCADGLIDTFDTFVRTDLLYKVEWDAHDKKFRPFSEKKNGAAENQSHKQYGIVHLLRLLSKMNTFLERMKLQKDIRYASQANIQDFVAFVNKNIRKYYSGDEEYKG